MQTLLDDYDEDEAARRMVARRSETLDEEWETLQMLGLDQ